MKRARIKTSTHMTGSKGIVAPLLLLSLILIRVVSAQNFPADGIQLQAFLKNVFPNYSSYFNTSLSVCQWQGVFCIGQGIQERIRTLDLSGLGLNGTILPGTLGVLSALTSLDLSSNSLTGEIPLDIFSLSSLSTLNLANNRLTGVLPDSVGNLPQLGLFNASKNLLTGSLPWELTNLRSLQTLDLHENNISGSIPTFNNAFLASLDLSSNQLNSTLPYAFGGLNNLAMLNLSRNLLTGDVSWQFQNNKLLYALDLSQNYFSGHLPGLQNLQQLSFLSLSSNRFNGSIPTGLIQLPSLQEISLANNGLTGPLPPLVYLQGTSTSSNLRILDCGYNFLNGSIPEGFVSALNLSVLRLASNDFTGPIPANLSFNLQELDLQMNHFSGNIPVSVANLVLLQKLDISMNLLNGSIPRVFANSTFLQYLSMAQNMFAEGFLPDVSQLTSLLYLNLSSCNIGGPIPSSFSALGSLVQLDISHNHLNGSIPVGCSQMTSLNILNLSYNNLSGVMPPELVSLTNLQGLDLSYNNLSGEVPHLNEWVNFGDSSYQGNPLLCGFPTRPCVVVVSPAPSTTTSTTAPVTTHTHPGRYLKPGAVVGIVLGVTLAICCFLTTVLLLFKKRPKRLPAKEVSKYLSGPMTFEADPSTWAVQVPHAGSIPVVMFEKPLLNLTFADLLQATSNFHKDTQIADGGYGPTYKALLPGGFEVLIKILFEGGPRNDYEKVAQLEVLGKIRHPNLVALVGYCLVGEERLLLYEFMENGDLQQRLHELPEGLHNPDDWTKDTWENPDSDIMRNAELSWPVRHRIALGTARALAFLHHGCCPHLVHRDVNSSNILLDSRYEPHLGDCGLASLIDDKHSDCPTIGGAIGYVPPEYGQMWKATTQGDVYSFGIVLLELVTGKRPTGHYFHDSYGGNLVGWVRALIREKKGYKCLDPKLLSTGAESEILETLRIGYLCTAELPSRRPPMQQIVGLLKDIQPEYI